LSLASFLATASTVALSSRLTMAKPLSIQRSFCGSRCLKCGPFLQTLKMIGYPITLDALAAINGQHRPDLPCAGPAAWYLSCGRSSSPLKVANLGRAATPNSDSQSAGPRFFFPRRARPLQAPTLNLRHPRLSMPSFRPVVVDKEQTSASCPCIFRRMKPKSPDSGRKLVARIERLMNLPRLTESVRTNGKDEAAPVAKRPFHRSP
jgi:hypothetical protein